ncbi:MAG: hypothetical protein R3185_04905 [Candidatus Thermoplasmatota archaeon]|nr:hypothetical protein [Candidatus Thermoplasmatota archaeon]
MDVDQRIAELSSDRTSGASELTAEALAVFHELALDAPDEEEARRAVRGAGLALLDAHPAMAPLVHLLNQALLCWDHEGSSVLTRLEEESKDRAKRLHEAGARRVPEEGTLVLYSRSGSVLRSVQQACREGACPDVILSEGRPAYEGLSLARTLSKEGLDVRVTTDTDLIARVGQADRVLIGADALCARGLVNKVGTRALFLVAWEEGVPVHVISGLDKLLPSSYAPVPPLTRETPLDHDLPGDIHQGARLFELAPLDHAREVVTEEGSLSPQAVVARARAEPVHADLTQALESRQKP